MIFRKTTRDDIPSVMEIILQAQQYFKEQNIDQWQNGYPNPETIVSDIDKGIAYVIEDNGRIIATGMVSNALDPTYTHIENGKWLNNEPYIVIHRIAINNNCKGKGIASKFLQEAIALYPTYKNIRIDTHADNLSMQTFLAKEGFHYCGYIYVSSGDKRNAYQKTL